jgi:hypothetical protein
MLMHKRTGFPAGTESPGQGIFGVRSKADNYAGVDQITDIRPPGSDWIKVFYLLSIGQAGTNALEPRRREGREGNLVDLEAKQNSICF